jgi:hypothetical protein
MWLMAELKKNPLGFHLTDSAPEDRDTLPREDIDLDGLLIILNLGVDINYQILCVVTYED